ncbi:SDR family oxidoreductase [Brevundimonas sp. BH3]|uniref:SDR family NAD(P)-dependent oxidoreductase n=1 Tax=Brevundimonas sp. BH3 TaxID=3133089 RepID=UPI00324552B3
MRGLKGKVGIVAGGGRGIGAATARRLAEEGAAVVIGDINAAWAQETAQLINDAGGRAIGVMLDGTLAASQANIVQAALSEFGALDFYHSNLAGGTEGDVDILNCTEEVLDRSFAINTKSHFLASQAAMPVMIARGGGAMIYTSSGAATSGNPMQVAYPMTKNAIHALVRHVARKFGKQGIRANAISPGMVMTEALSQHLTEEYAQQFLAQLPHTRLGKPEDIAGAVAFLASDDGQWVNGQVWHVNGGSVLRD